MSLDTSISRSNIMDKLTPEERAFVNQMQRRSLSYKEDKLIDIIVKLAPPPKKLEDYIGKKISSPGGSYGGRVIGISSLDRAKLVVEWGSGSLSKELPDCIKLVE